MVNVKDTDTRTYSAKKCFFADDGTLMITVKDGEPEVLELAEDIEKYFGGGLLFDISITAKDETEIGE